MAKTLLLQHKELSDRADALTAQLAALQTEKGAADKLAQEQADKLAAANETIAALRLAVDAAQTKDAELCQELATAQAEVVRLTGAAQTAAQVAQNIVADVGVPAVSADAVATPNKAQAVTDLQAEYGELLKTDSRAAGEFYHTKLAPALRKENK
jgi:hypothetical protein